MLEVEHVHMHCLPVVWLFEKKKKKDFPFALSGWFILTLVGWMPLHKVQWSSSSRNNSPYCVWSVMQTCNWEFWEVCVCVLACIRPESTRCIFIEKISQCRPTVWTVCYIAWQHLQVVHHQVRKMFWSKEWSLRETHVGVISSFSMEMKMDTFVGV